MRKGLLTFSGLALAVSWIVCSLLAAQTTAPAGPPVPDSVLERLKAQYIPEDDKAAGISESDKVRRYTTMLREGAWAERQYAAAPNLYQVREWMMAAAKGLATLEGTAESRQRLMEIARRMAESPAPPEAKLPANLLLTRVRLDELGDAPAEAADEIEHFIAGYAQTPIAYKAIMGAIELARVVGAVPVRRACLRRLMRDHFAEPGVTELLESEGLAPYHGRLFPAKLTKLDGSPLILPRDLLGKFTIVHFWSIEKHGLTSRRNVKMLERYEKLHPAGLEILGVNLDTDRAKVARFVEQERMPWLHTCSGLASKDPTYLHYRIPGLPCWWQISPDGRAVCNNYREGFVGHSDDWAGVAERALRNLESLQETMVRVPYYRCGEFLLGERAIFPETPPAPGDVPAQTLAAIEAKANVPACLGVGKELKADWLRQAISLGEEAQKKYPSAANLAAVRNWMLVAARWLSNETARPPAVSPVQIASRILASRPAPAARLLADFAVASDEFVALDPRKAGDRIDAFRLPYGKTDLKWAADILAVVLAAECGDEVTRAIVVRELGEQAAHPKVRGFLRDFCNINIDARTTPFEYQPLMTMAAGGDRIDAEPYEIRAELPRLDGGVFRLPDEAKRRLVLLHFWSTTCPPDDSPLKFMHKNVLTSFAGDVTVVGVSLDRSREAVELFLKANPQYAKWVHIFSGRGADDPLARELDVVGLPRSVLIDRDGTIFRWGSPAHMPEAVYRALNSPPRRPAAAPGPPASRPYIPTTAPIDSMPREITLNLDAAAAAIKLFLIVPDSFRMGPSSAESRRWDDEIPQRYIFLTKPYYIAPHTVTRGQFAAFVSQTGYTTEAEQEGWALSWTGTRWSKVEGASWKKPGFDQTDSHPAVCISWNDASEFCKWLSGKSGRGIRLPTEAQWEYACRAGSGSIFLWGDDASTGDGWCNAADQSLGNRAGTRTPFAWNDGHVFTSPVGSFKPNAWGLFDMVGNVWQWTADWQDKSYLWEHPGHWKPSRIDPTGPDSGTYKVLRGGSWQGGPAQCRPAARRPAVPTFRSTTIGFRIIAQP